MPTRTSSTGNRQKKEKRNKPFTSKNNAKQHKPKKIAKAEKKKKSNNIKTARGINHKSPLS